MSKVLRRKKLKKRRILKSISLAGLAVVIGAAGIFAFAPIGASASTPPTTTSGLGLDPKNDPVIYTTESGLEIKWGNAAPSGDMKEGQYIGYPYFTMGNYNGTPVNWILIGRASDTNVTYEKIETFLFDEWQSSTYESNNRNYFFNNIFETFSPAGALIESIIASRTYIKDFVQIAFSQVVEDPNIPNGCFLAFSEYVMGTCAGNHTYTNTTLKTNMDAMPTTLGISEDQMKLVQTVDVYCTNNDYNKTWITCTGLQFFPLPCRSTSEDFYIYNYLDTTLAIGYDISTKAATSYYSMSGCGSYSWDWGGYTINTSGGVTNVRSNVVSGIRPACVLKI